MTTSSASDIARPAAYQPIPEPLKYAMAVVETMMGRRSLHSVRRLVAEKAFVVLSQHRLSGLFMRSQAAGWRCKMPTPTAAEISVRISTAARWRVCVLRMDYDEKWRCSDLVVLGA